MDTHPTASTSRMLLCILRPLIGVLLKLGFGHGAFAEVTRQAFVLEGFQHLRKGGDKATASAVAALTGLSRKEVKRLSSISTDELTAAAMGRNRATRVLAGWTTDQRFSTGGIPKVLSLDSIEEGFQSLVEAYSGDITPIAMLAVLEQGGCIERVDGGVALIRNAYLPMTTTSDRLNILGTDVGELIHTIAHNIESETQERLFQRKVSAQGLSAANLADFKLYTTERSQALLEEYDLWLSDRLANQGPEDSEITNDVALGIYFYTPTWEAGCHEEQ